MPDKNNKENKKKNSIIKIKEKSCINDDYVVDDDEKMKSFKLINIFFYFSKK